MKKSKQGRCTYCGEQRAVTREHVPADNLFRSPKPSNLTTVPACRQCNVGASKDDEYFRDTMAFRAELSTEPSAQEIIGTFSRSFARSESARYKRDLLSRVRPRELVTRAGLYLGEELVCRVSGERIERVLQRTVRGLYFDNECRRLPTNCPIWCCELSPLVIKDRALLAVLDSAAQDIISGGMGREFGDVFRYRYLKVEGTDPEDEYGSWWVLSYFNRVNFCAHTGSLSPKSVARRHPK